MSPQAQGSETQLIISEELTFKTIPEEVVEDCEIVWDEVTGAGVTISLDNADYKVGSGSAKFVEDGATAAGAILAAEDITSDDYTDYTHLVAWVKSDIALSAGDYHILLDDTALCDSPLEILSIPALVAETWTQIKIALNDPSLLTAIISVGVKQTVDAGENTFRIDDIRVIKQATLLYFNSETLKRSTSLNRSNAISNSRNPKAPTRGALAVEGDITIEANPHIGLLLKHLFGTYSVTGGDPYLHTFKIGSLPTGLQIEKGFTDLSSPQYFDYNGCRVNTMSMSAAPDGVLEMSFGVIGATQTIRTTPMDPSPIDNNHSPFEGLEATITEGGATLGIGTALEFEINNNCDGSVYVIGGGGERYSVPSGIVSVSGKLSILFENMTLYNKALNFTESKLQITYSKGAADGTDGDEVMDFYFDEVKYAEDTPVISGPTGILVELPFEAYYDDDADASAVYATLWNTTASYDTY